MATKSRLCKNARIRHTTKKRARNFGNQRRSIIENLSPEEQALWKSFDRNLSDFNSDDNYKNLQDKARKWFLQNRKVLEP